MSITGITGLSPLVSAAAAASTTAEGSSASTSSTAASTASGSAAASSASSSSPTDSLLAPNQFLSLLVDSLKYQDPLDPTSSADFLQQLASLSQVQTESQVAQTDQTSAAANLIGHTITGTDPSGVAITGEVTGFSMTSTGPDLDVGTDTVSLGSISSVGAGQTAPAGTTAPTATTTSPTA